MLRPQETYQSIYSVSQDRSMLVTGYKDLAKTLREKKKNFASQIQIC